MVTNFSSPIKGANGGSCQRLAGYLEKENNQLPPHQQEAFFCAHSDKVSQVEVVAGIDRNGAAQGLKTGQDRFYTFTIDPSQKELAHIGGDPAKLRDYTRAVMDNYAQNFGKGIESKDLVWYARLNTAAVTPMKIKPCRKAPPRRASRRRATRPIFTSSLAVSKNASRKASAPRHFLP